MHTPSVLAALLGIVFSGVSLAFLVRNLRIAYGVSPRGVGRARYTVLELLTTRYPSGTMLITADGLHALHVARQGKIVGITVLEMANATPERGTGFACGNTFALVSPRRTTVTRMPFGYRVERNADGKLVIPAEEGEPQRTLPSRAMVQDFPDLVYATPEQVDELTAQLVTAQPYVCLHP